MVSKDNLVIVTVYNRLFSNEIILKYRINATRSSISALTYDKPSACLTFNPPNYTTPLTTTSTLRPKSTTKTRCREYDTVCPSLVKSGFCTDPANDNATKKLLCPASCGFC
ncbi:shTK domain protein [Dictyocaulus viviparus]|uniref:ShTK domain protein n=1 Tax=Dictyocaulus viviparus TaxID=29172 RepID=A0A0D8X5Q8_DICVI|nr:shTK domain protein [Dictyocaulus viviparus]